MHEVELAEGAPVEIPVQLRRVRGDAQPIDLLEEGTVLIGQPMIRRLTAEGVSDAELAAFIRSEARTWDYYLMAMSCTFVSSDKQKVVEGRVRISFPPETQATSHSMDPLLLEEIRQLSHRITLTVPCVIVNPELTYQGDRNKKEAAVTAQGEGRSRFGWTFNALNGRPLHGVQRLRVVVRVPAGEVTAGQIDVAASMRHSKFSMNVFTYESSPKQTRDALGFRLQ